MGWLALGIGVALVSASACSKPACIEGQSIACACPSGTGAQTCNSNGTFSPCTCGGFDNLAAAAAAMDHAKKSKKTEAELQLNKILKNNKVEFNTRSSFVVGSAKALPVGAACTTGKFPVTNAWASDPVWSALDFQIDEPNLFQYSYTGGATAAMATAVGDLDCDGMMITYTLAMSVVDGIATGSIGAPPPNSD